MSNKTDNAANGHTPGPWIVQADPAVTQEQRENWAAHNFRYITTDHQFDEDGVFEHDGGKIICKTTDAAEQEANARLIASAPDLLKALEAAAWFIEQDERKQRMNKDVILGGIRAAIGFAKGQ